jgi:hypothetical protein
MEIDFKLWSDAMLAAGERHAHNSEHGAELLAEIERRKLERSKR